MSQDVQAFLEELDPAVRIHANRPEALESATL